MLFVPLHFNTYKHHGPLDTGAVQSERSKAELRKITAAYPIRPRPTSNPNFRVQIGNGTLVPIRKQILLRFFIAGKVLPFFEK